MYIIDLENLTVSNANVCSVNVCGIGTCGKPVECNGYCNKHYKRTYFKIGYNQPIEGQKYYPTTNGHGKKTKCYEEWHNMMQRCYNPKYKKTHPSYHGVYVCKEWHNFQAFAEWREENYYECKGERMHLDKDLFSTDNSCTIFDRGNNIKYTDGGCYSPKTCCFLPERLNLLFRNGIQKLGSNDIKGINKDNIKYKEFKIQTITEEYKEYLPKHIYDKLMEYEIEDYENSTMATFNDCFRVDENESNIQSSDSNNPNIV